MEPGYFRHHEGWIVSDISGVWNDHIAAAGYNLKRSETFVTVLKSDGSVVYTRVFQHLSGLGLWRRFVTSAEPLQLVTCLEDVLDLLAVDDRDIVKSTKLQNSPARCIESDGVKKELYIGIDKSTELFVYNFELELIRRLTFSADKPYDWPRDLAVFNGVLFVSTGERPEKIISIQGITGKELKEYKTPLVDKDYRPYSVAINTAAKVIISWINHVTVHSILHGDGQCLLVIPVNNGASRVTAINESKITTLDRNTGILCTYDTKHFFTFENFTATVSRILTEDDCKKLSRFFGLSGAYREQISQSSHPTQCLLKLLEERRIIQPISVKKLKEGFLFLKRNELIYLAQTYQENRHVQRNSTYENFLSSLSYCFTTAVSGKLCDAFNLSKEAKESITSSMAPGLALLAHLEDSGIIQQSDVHALEKPLKELELVQAAAIVDEYSDDVGHTLSTKISLEKVSSGSLTLQVKTQLFIEALRKKISSWCKVVSPIPWKKACQWKLRDVYVDRRLILTHFQTKMFREDVDSKCILQYSDIFTHEKLATAKRIIIEGEPGSGKTMLMSQIASDWCNGALSGIEIFVPLQLKLVGNMTIPQAIKICYLPEDTPLTNTDIEEILQTSSSNCVMLDGLEEYTGFDEDGEGHPSEMDRIMNENVLTNCKIVLTIRSSYLADFHRCPLLTLLGFGEKERHTYIDKIFKDTTQGQRVRNMLDGSPFLSDLCRVPLLFVLAVHMIRDGDDFRASQYDKVTPFMRDMIDSLMPSVVDDDVSEAFSLKELAFNGLCRGKQQLSWQKEFVERNIGNLKRWLDSGVLVVEHAANGVDDGEIASEAKYKDEFVLERGRSSNSDVIDSSLRGIVAETSDVKESGNTLNVSDPRQPKIESKDHGSSDISARKTVTHKINEAALHVRFMHKIIQEWFAAEYFSTLIDKFDLEQLEQCLRLIDPLDLHYVLRFTCGLNSRSFPTIAKYILKNCRSMEGKLLNPIIDCLCYCFAEHEGDKVPLKTIVKKICRENINIMKEDNRFLQSSKASLMKYASENKVPVAKLVLDNVISSVTRLGIKLNTGITLQPLTTMQEMEVVRLDHELTLEDYFMLISIIARQEALQKACLQFPSPPPAVRGSILSEFSHAKKVIWQMGKVSYILDIKTGDWRLVKQQDISPVIDHLQLEVKSIKSRLDQLDVEIEALASTKKDVTSLQQKFSEMDSRLSAISERRESVVMTPADSGSSSHLGGLQMESKGMEGPVNSLKRPLPKTNTGREGTSVMSEEVLRGDEQHLSKRRRTSSLSRDYDTASRAEKFGMKAFPYREQYIDEKGGDLSIPKAKVYLHIPQGALTEGVVISLTVFSDQDLFDSPEVDAPNLCPLVKCEPNGLHFQKPVQLKIPHCGVISGSSHSADVFHGDHIEGKVIDWKKCKSSRCEVDSEYFTVYLNHFTYVYPTAIGENIKKRVRAVPLISRMISSSEDAMITFWLCNDTDADYDALMHEELHQHDKTPLDAYEDFVINNSGRSIVSKISQVNDDWVPYQDERRQRIKHRGIWNGTRRKSIFRLQNRTSSDVAILKSSLNSKQKGPDADRVTFALEKPIAAVLRTSRGQGGQPFSVSGATETMMESFGTLQVDIAAELDEAACINIATCFMLPRPVKDDIRCSTTRGLYLLDILIQRGLFSEENVGSLCSCAQKLRMDSVVQMLRNFRRNNPTNMSTVSPVLV